MESPWTFKRIDDWPWFSTFNCDSQCYLSKLSSIGQIGKIRPMGSSQQTTNCKHQRRNSIKKFWSSHWCRGYLKISVWYKFSQLFKSWRIRLFLNRSLNPIFLHLNQNGTIICRNDELSLLFTNRLSATRYIKFKRMGMTEILRRIWLFSANKVHIFWEGHKILQNLHLTSDWHYLRQK